MSGTLFTGHVFHTLQATIENFVQDELESSESSLICKEWLEEGHFGKKMSSHWEDDLEMIGPTLLSEKKEGMNITPVTLREGALTRYYARTIAGEITATDEVMEDTKYPEVVRAVAYLNAALYLTLDVDMTNILARAWNTDYAITDGMSQPLASASHQAGEGVTWSNTMAVPLPPSVLSVSTARAAVRAFPGHNGYRGFGNYMLKKVVCPIEQESIWETLVLSEKTPVAGNFAEINIVQRMKLKVVPIVYWQNTTTNYGFITNAKNGIQHRWKRKPRSRTWTTNGSQTLVWSCSARWSNGCSDARGFYGVQS